MLQVLALMGRTGPTLGEQGVRLGHLATEQERALRTLIADVDEAPIASQREDARVISAGSTIDLRRELLALAGERVRVAGGSDPVLLDAARAHEVLAATRQALANTENHAGAGATAYVLLEDLTDDVVVTVRDDGVGIPDGRLDEASGDGRMGVRRSIVGRIENLGGRAQLVTAPGEGVEWEFTIPR